MNFHTSLYEACKKILSLALPMAGTQLLNISSGFLCMTMLATLGHDVLAASALIFSTQVSIMVTGMSVLFSIGILVGHSYGAKDNLAIGNYLQQGWTLAILIGIPIMILFWNIDTILLFLGQPKEIVNIVYSFFHAFVWAVIPGLLATANMQFGYGLHRKKLIVSISMISILLLLVTAYTLIFGKFGFPKLGVAGLAYAIATQYSSFVIISTLFFFFGKSFAPHELFRYRVHQHLNHFSKMFKMGWPMSVQMGGEMLSFFVSGIMIGWIGTVALAAFQVINQYYFLIIVPIFSLSQATAILVGHACGAKQFHEIKNLSYASIALALMISSIVAILFLSLPKLLAAAYMNVHDPMNAATLHLTIVLFIVTALSQMLDAVRNVLIGILRGLFDTRFAMLMSLLTIWLIGIPLSYVLALTMHLGAVGFLMGGLLGMCVGVAAIAYRWYSLKNSFLFLL